MENNQHEQIMVKLGVIDEKLDNTEKHLASLNGKAASNMLAIGELKISDTKIKTSLQTGKNVGMWALAIIFGLIGTITSISLYAYRGDKINLITQTANVADKANTVAKDLTTYQNEQTAQQMQIIDLLTKLTKK